MAYANYEYYTNVYGGTAIAPDAFTRMADRASAYIDAVTLDRAKNAVGGKLESVKKAVCALAEIIQDEERLNANAFASERQVQSETVGTWTRNYGTKSTSATDVGLLDNRKRETLLIYLGNTGLLRMRGYRA